MLPITVLSDALARLAGEENGSIMWLEIGLATTALLVVAGIAARFLRGRAAASGIDVGMVSGGWLIEHRSSTCDPYST